MRLPEGERLDDALEMFHSHRWVTNKPAVGEAQFAEWLQAMWPWFARELAPPRKPKPAKRQKVQQRRTSEPSIQSSHIPAAIRKAVLQRDSFTCQRCGRSIYGIRAGIQHRRPRQMGGSKLLHTMPNLVLLCGWTVDKGTCTEWVELKDRRGAERDGWLVPLGADPEDWPVKRFGQKWMQPGDGWSESLPHPRQVEMCDDEGAA